MKPYKPVAPYILSVKWSADDPGAVLVPSADTLTVVMTIPANDAAKTINLTATAIDPNGAVQSTVFSVPVLPEPSTFALSIVQTAYTQ